MNEHSWILILVVSAVGAIVSAALHDRTRSGPERELLAVLLGAFIGVFLVAFVGVST